MTMRCTVQVEIEPPIGEGRPGTAAVIDRPDELAPETLGLTPKRTRCSATCRPG